MIEINVDKIYEQNKVINGLSIIPETVGANMKIIYDDDAIIGMMHIIKTNPKKDFLLIHKFCQFVTYFEYTPTHGSGIRFIDFSADMDIALEEYLILQEKGWHKQTRDRVMDLFQEIQSSPIAKAKLVCTNPLPFPSP